jgi:hypothetical protein
MLAFAESRTARTYASSSPVVAGVEALSISGRPLRSPELDITKPNQKIRKNGKQG